MACALLFFFFTSPTTHHIFLLCSCCNCLLLSFFSLTLAHWWSGYLRDSSRLCQVSLLSERSRISVATSATGTRIWCVVSRSRRVTVSSDNVCGMTPPPKKNRVRPTREMKIQVWGRVVANLVINGDAKGNTDLVGTCIAAADSLASRINFA